jgi:hypothetical protein
MQTSRGISLAIFILGVSFGGRSYGQAVSARLEGIVQDQSKAVVPGVTVIAVDQNTAAQFQAVSNDSGRYIFATLPPGTYTVSAEQTGFKKTVVQGILLQIGDAKAQDLTLTTGEVTESVTVTSESASVDATTATLGDVVQNRQAVDLPLNGRDPMMLFYLEQGTNPLDRVASSQQQVGAVNGLDPNTSSVKVEGINASNGGYDYSPAHPSMAVPQEAVGEYRVSTSTDLADAGRGSGAQVKVLLKSGTNQFHGSLFEFNRNTDYNANDFFNNRNGLARPVLQRNQFGGSFGGPIRRNKTFFFATAEWQRQISDSIENRVVYTPTLRTGIFRYLIGGTNSTSIVDAHGNPTVPATSIGTINLATIDPTRQGIDTMYFPKLLNLMPQPNNYALGDGLNTAGYTYNSANPDNYYQVLFKVDHELNDKNHLAISASQGIENAPQARLEDGISPEGFEERRRGFSVRLVTIATPHMTNELSLGANDRTSQRPITNDAPFPGVYGPGQQTPAGNIQFVGLGTGSSLTGGTNGNLNIIRSPQVNPAVNRGGQDEVTWIKGNHTLYFGGELWLEAMNRTVGTQQYPIIDTSNSSNPANIPALAGLSSTDRSFAAQLANDVTGTIGAIKQTFYLDNRTGFIPYQQSYEPLRKTESAWFIQDVWKVLPRLSVNAGLRWEYLPPVTLANGAYVYPVGGVAGALGVQGATGKPTQWGFADNDGGDIYHTQKNNFGPSLGLAWDPFGDGKTAIRAAYRIAYDRFAMVNGDFSTNNYGQATSTTLTPQARFSSPNLYSGILPLPTPALFAPLGNVRQGNAYVADSNLGNPFVHLWNFTIERQVGRVWKISGSYVGNHAVGMWRGINLNQDNITTSGFLSAFQIAQANLAANGNPTTGQSLGNLTALFKLVPSSQYNLITQGQVAALADYLDTNTAQTGTRGGLVTLAGLPSTFFRYNPQVQNLYIVGNRSHSTFDALQLAGSRRFDHGFYFQANYTFSKALSDQLPGQTYTNDYRDVNNPHLDKSLSPYDATHVVLMNGIWELPVGHGRHYLASVNPLIDGVIGGWQLNGIFNFSTGRPMLITTNRFNVNQTVASNPNFGGGFNNLGTVHEGPNLVTFITPAQAAAFTNPGPGSPGTLASYAMHGPGFSTVDVSLFKKFPLFKERAQLQVRAEFFNVLNHPSFQSPPSTSLNIDSGSFGVLTSAYPARIGQFAMKLTF